MTSSDMEHMDQLIANLSTDEIAYLRGALESLEVPEPDADEQIPTELEDEE